MSELENSLKKLRDGLRSSIGHPDLDLVAVRARQRAVRRRMQGGAITAVVAVSLTVPLLRSVPGEQDATDPVRIPVTYQVDFADALHGYALGSACGDSDSSCTITLLATADRGRSWRQRELPGDDKLYADGDLFVVDQNRLRLYRMSGTSRTVHILASDDGGRSWHTPAAAAEVAAAPNSVPSGMNLQKLCHGNGSSECAAGVGAVTLGGSLSPTPTQPPAEVRVLGAAPTTSGRYWAVSQDPTTKGWTISVTSDAGRTWHTTPVDLPGVPWPEDAPWSVVEGNGVLYATAVGMIGSGPFGLLAVFRSTDGGLSWTQTWRATPDTVLKTVTGSAVATLDGRLLVYSATEGTFESTDGRRFSRAADALPGPVAWTRAGYLAKVKDNEYDLSSNGGRTWLVLRLP
ncbi:hypothetical protein [Actinophytocola sp.]|uniref:hypothetical protein n=1 Tax=Actinophytocola sp. TaxID=1872138 RepID=UPI00389AA3C7